MPTNNNMQPITPLNPGVHSTALNPNNTMNSALNPTLAGLNSVAINPALNPMASGIMGLFPTLGVAPGPFTSNPYNIHPYLPMQGNVNAMNMSLQPGWSQNPGQMMQPGFQQNAHNLMNMNMPYFQKVLKQQTFF